MFLILDKRSLTCVPSSNLTLRLCIEAWKIAAAAAAKPKPVNLGDLSIEYIGTLSSEYQRVNLHQFGLEGSEFVTMN